MNERRGANRDGADSAAHDVLAAEEFALPVADPSIHPGPVVLPDDPTGIAEAHDVLAAEEFAMPAVRPHPGVPVRTGVSRSRVTVAAIALLLIALLARRARRSPTLPA